MSSARPPRLRPLPPEVLAFVREVEPGMSDAALHDRLESALAALPDTERAAVVAAYGYSEGPAQIATELHVRENEVESLLRSALQLLRAALADVTTDTGAGFGVLERRRSAPQPD